MTEAILHGMLPSSLDKRQKAHIASVVPGDPSRWDVPEEERNYLCGRKAAELHSRTFPWSVNDDFPTCKRCRAEATRILEPERSMTDFRIERTEDAAVVRFSIYEYDGDTSVYTWGEDDTPRAITKVTVYKRNADVFGEGREPEVSWPSIGDWRPELALVFADAIRQAAEEALSMKQPDGDQWTDPQGSGWRGD